MNPEDAIRRLRAADRWVPMEPRFLAPAPESASGSPQPGGRRSSGRIRIAVVTAVVLALVIVGGASVIRLAGPRIPASPSSPTPASTSKPTPSAGSVGALPQVAGRVLATWTTQSRLPVTKTLDARGGAIAITLACTGGGSVAYTIVGRSDTSHGCDGVVTAGPELHSKDGELVAEHAISVRVSVTGHPRFALRITAVPVAAAPTIGAAPTVASTGPAVPATFRTCGAHDLKPAATYERWPHFEGGLLTVTSAATTDCAIRSWPTLGYIDRAGATIGGPAARSGDGTVTPVRLAAHGTTYVQIELFTLDRLTTCRAKPVAGLLLGIGRATVRVPIPAKPVVGKCVDPDTVADGVGAATAYKPTGP